MTKKEFECMTRGCDNPKERNEKEKGFKNEEKKIGKNKCSLFSLSLRIAFLDKKYCCKYAFYAKTIAIRKEKKRA